MNMLSRIKAAFNNVNYLRASMRVSQGEDAKKQPFSYAAAVKSYSSWVYAAANLNAVAVASQPLRLYVRSRPGMKLYETRPVSRRTKAFLAGGLDQLPSRHVMRKAAEYGDEFEVVTENHPVLDLLEKVNPYQNGYDATVLRVLYTELTGNAYLHPVIDRTLGIPVELWTMPSQWVEIVPGKERFLDGYLYGATREQRRFFAADEVIHFKRPNPADMYYGIGKVEAAWGAVQSNEEVHNMDFHFFANKARPDWLMTIKGAVSAEELERLETQIDEKLRGGRRTGRFLTASTDIDIKPLSFPPKDLAGRSEIVEEIAAVFGVPVSMLKANDPNLASATVGFASWKSNTILPLLRMDEEVLNQSLLPLFGIEGDAFLAYDNPVMSDERFEFEKARTSVATGLMTVNEARVRDGLERVDDPAADRLLFSNQPLGGVPQPAVPPAMPILPATATEPAATASVASDGTDGTDQAAQAETALATKSASGGCHGNPQHILGAVDEKATDPCVGEKISKLMSEGYPQDQAIAIAISMCDGEKQKAIGDIDTKPPQVVADNAQRALDVRETKPESQRGMTAVGIARARDLSNRMSLSEETIRRMVAYFERHQSDKQGQTWDEQGAGWQAWMGWGGDEGWSWAKRKRDEFDRQRGEKSEESDVEMFAKWISECVDESLCTKDCGSGAGGFKPGNDCSSNGSSSGSSSTASSPKPPSPKLDAPKKHDVALPSNPRRMTVDQFDAGLSAMGYERVSSRVENPNSRTDRRQLYTVRDASGNTTEVDSHDLLASMYASSSDPKLSKVKPVRRRKSAGCDCGCDGTVSQKALWSMESESYAIVTKASRKDVAKQFDAITEDEGRIGRAVDKVLQRQIDAVIKKLNASTIPSRELTLEVESVLKSARWDRELVEALRPYLQRSLENGISIGLDSVKQLAKAMPDFNPDTANLDAYARSESVRLSRGVARGVNEYTKVRVSKILGDGIESGETPKQLADRVREWAGEKGDAARATQSRALTIARTEANRATRRAESEAWKSTGLVEGKTWLLAPDPCEFCQAAADAFGTESVGINEPFFGQGTVLKGADGNEMTLDYEAVDGPPLHPNCRCSMQPKLIDDYESIIKDMEKDLAMQNGPWKEPE